MSGLGIFLKILELLLDTPLSNGPLETSKLLDLLLHHVVEAVIESRDTDHDGWLEHCEILPEFQHVSLEEAILHAHTHRAKE